MTENCIVIIKGIHSYRRASGQQMLRFISWLLSFFFSRAHPPQPPRHHRFDDEDTTDYASDYTTDSNLEEIKDIERGDTRDDLWRISYSQDFIWKINSISQQLELVEASTGRQLTPTLSLALYFTAETTRKRAPKSITLKHTGTRPTGQSNMKIHRTGTRRRSRITRIYTLCGVSCDQRLTRPETTTPEDRVHPWNTPASTQQF